MKNLSLLSIVLMAIILPVSTMTFFKSLTQTAYGQASINDNALNVEAALEGLSSPTSMAFLDDNISTVTLPLMST
jgi:hypothetical protein